MEINSWHSGMGKKGRDLQPWEVWYLGCRTITGKQARASSRQRVGWSSNGWAQYLRCCTANRNLKITHWTGSFFAPLLIATALSFVLNKNAPVLWFFFLPCLWTRALCLCNKNWSDFPAIPTLGEDRFCSSLADPADSLHNTEFLQVCYSVTQEPPSLLHQTHSTHQTLHKEKQNYFNKGEGSPILRGNHQKCFSFYLLITPSLQSLCTLFEDIESPSSGKKLYIKVLVQEQKEIKRHHFKRLFLAESWKKKKTTNTQQNGKKKTF